MKTIKKILILLVSIALCNTYMSCGSLNLENAIIVDLDENPTAEYIIDASWLKNPYKIKVITYDKWDNSTKEYEGLEILQILEIQPNTITRIRFDAKTKADAYFLGESTKRFFGILGEKGFGNGACFAYLDGKSRRIKFTSKSGLWRFSNGSYREDTAYKN